MVNNSLNWEKFCPLCIHFDTNMGVCSRIHENIHLNPAKFEKKCSGKFFEFDQTKKTEKSKKGKVSEELEPDETDEIDETDESMEIIEDEKGGFYNSKFAKPFGIFMIIATIGLSIYSLKHYGFEIHNIRNIAIFVFLCIAVVQRIFKNDKNK